jgi:hypothetical protein
VAQDNHFDLHIHFFRIVRERQFLVGQATVRTLSLVFGQLVKTLLARQASGNGSTVTRMAGLPTALAPNGRRRRPLWRGRFNAERRRRLWRGLGLGRALLTRLAKALGHLKREGRAQLFVFGPQALGLGLETFDLPLQGMLLN